MDLAFLKSNRFWAGVIGCFATTLVSEDFPTNPWYVNLGKFLGLLSAVFIGIRTIDRTSEYLGESQK